MALLQQREGSTAPPSCCLVAAAEPVPPTAVNALPLAASPGCGTSPPPGRSAEEEAALVDCKAAQRSMARRVRAAAAAVHCMAAAKLWLTAHDACAAHFLHHGTVAHPHSLPLHQGPARPPLTNVVTVHAALLAGVEALAREAAELACRRQRQRGGAGVKSVGQSPGLALYSSCTVQYSCRAELHCTADAAISRACMPVALTAACCLHAVCTPPRHSPTVVPRQQAVLGS